LSTEGGAPQELHANLEIRRLDALDSSARALLEARNFVVVCTLGRKGTIHGTPMWVDTDGTNVLLNTEADRAWVRNLSRDDHVTCTVVNLEVPYEFVEVRGRALQPDEEGGLEHAHTLAQKYLELDRYPYPHPDKPRVIIRVVPERVTHMSPPDDEALNEAIASVHDEGSG
jgi:PPOX class probable F420-dependent enzyme